MTKQSIPILLLSSAAFQLPHPSKLGKSCEDAYFISSDNHTIGVADGVGGWANHPGSESSQWSHCMMQNCEKYSEISDNPLEIAEKSFSSLQNMPGGSTTSVVGKLVNSTMRFFNIGDSGCAVFRDSRMFFETKRTTHGFNFPYQIGFLGSDSVRNGTLENVAVEFDDTIVCATDGLWDNLYMHEIEDILFNTWMDCSYPSLFTKTASRRLVEKAVIRAGNPSASTPFSDEALKNGVNFEGGKLDDTTVVVSRIIEQPVEN